MAIWKIDKRGWNEECQMEAVKRLNFRPMGLSGTRPRVDLQCKEEEESEIHSQPKESLIQAVNPLKLKSGSEDELDNSGPCFNFCLNGANCTLTTLDVPICLCGQGFVGERCQIDSCHNYCLNGGMCSMTSSEISTSLPNAAVINWPSCQCNSDFSGDRCQIALNDIQDSQEVFFILFLILLGVILAVSFCAILFLFFRNKRLNEELRKNKQPQIIRKRSTSRSFSGNQELSRNRNREMAGNLNSAEFHDGCGNERGADAATASSCGGGSTDGVVIDLEDCCKMTLCDKVNDMKVIFLAL